MEESADIFGLPPSAAVSVHPFPPFSLRNLMATGGFTRVQSADNFSDMPPLLRRDSQMPRLPRPQVSASDSSSSSLAGSTTESATHVPPRRSMRLARADPSAIAAAPQQSVPEGDFSHSRPRKRTRSSVKPNSDDTSPNKRLKSLKKPPPSPVAEMEKEKEDESDKKPSAEAPTCTICMCEPERSEISSIDGCEHLYCFSCIGQWAERENTCPLCKARFSRINRINPQRRKKDSNTPVHNIKRVKKRDQRSDLPSGAALEGLLASIAGGAAFGNRGLGRILAAQFAGPVAHRRMRTAHMEVTTSRTSRFEAATLFPPFFAFEEDDADAGFVDLMSTILRSHNEARHDEDVLPGISHHLSMTGFAALPSVAHSFIMTSRSHASNANDYSAGHARENPLEIDDDSEDEVQILQVTRS